MRKCSRTGPKVKIGRKLSEPTITIVAIKTTAKVAVSVGTLPGDFSRIGCIENSEASAKAGIARKNRPTIMAIAVVML